MDVNSRQTLSASYKAAKDAAVADVVAHAKQHNSGAPINALPEDVATSILGRLPFKDLVRTSAASRSLFNAVVRNMRDAVYQAIRAVENIHLAQDPHGAAVAASRDAIARLPTEQQTDPKTLLNNKITAAINALRGHRGDREAFAGAYTRLMRQVLAMPRELIHGQLASLLGGFNVVPVERQAQVLTAAVDAIASAPEALRPVLCNQFLLTINQLPEHYILPTVDHLLTIAATMPAEQRAKALASLPFNMLALGREMSREMFERVAAIVDTSSAPLVALWCDARAASLDYSEDDPGDRHRINQALQWLNALPNEAARAHGLEALLDSIVVNMEFSGATAERELTFPASLITNTIARLPDLDAQTRAHCLENMTYVMDLLPAESRAQTWHLLMNQVLTLGDRQSSTAVTNLSGCLHVLSVDEAEAAINRLLEASNQLPKKERVQCARSIFDHLREVRSSNPEKLPPLLQTMIDYSQHVALEDRVGYLKNLKDEFELG